MRVTGFAVLAAVAAALWYWWGFALTEPQLAQPGSAASTTRSAEIAARGLQITPDAAIRTPVQETADAASIQNHGRKTIWGRVLRASDDKPIAGALVRLLHRPADESHNYYDFDYLKQVTRLGNTTTAADGSFRFTVEHAGRFQLEVTASGYPLVRQRNCVGASEVLVRLGEMSSLRGMVTAAGKALARAEVRVFVDETHELASGRTEVDGSFHFTGLQPTLATVYIDAPGHDSGWQRVKLRAGEPQSLVFDLAVGRTIRGRVIIKATGEPLAGAEIQVSKWPRPKVVRTGSDGRFSVDGRSADGPVGLVIRAPGFAMAQCAVQVGFEGEVLFELQTGGTVLGRFLDRDGKGLQNVFCVVAARGELSSRETTIDQIRAQIDVSGQFVLANLRPEMHYWFYLRGHGLGTQIFALPRQLKRDERLDLGDIVLYPAGGIEGRVLDQDYNPRPSSGVSLHRADPAAVDAKPALPSPLSNFLGNPTVVDNQGRFFFGGLDAGNYVVSAAQSRMSARIETAVTVESGMVTPGAELVVPIGKSISGVLRYPDGRSLVDGHRWFLLAVDKDERLEVARVGAKGRFSFRGLGDGEFTLRNIALKQRGWNLRPRTGVRSGTDKLELVLEPTRVLAGQVVDLAGKPVRAIVWSGTDAQGPGEIMMSATDPVGRFEFHVLPGFKETLYAAPPDTKSTKHPKGQLIGARVGQRDLRIRMRTDR